MDELKDLEDSGRGLSEILSWHWSGAIVRTARVPADIRTENPSKIKLEHYGYTNQLVKEQEVLGRTNRLHSFIRHEPH
jgi:hypothetical protein